jgi:uncharacterized Rossmann fold enzyme/2-polyprenyl-3-methyl-5-hydroxy-6-metoxy-1,4-benzoquinol methylase
MINPLEKQKTHFCVPEFVRDEQIKLSLKRIEKRLDPSHIEKNESIAVVCFGPSLKKTWEQVRNFKNIITCSGSHKFLVDRGIIPTYHIEVDPREHKVTLLGNPQKDTKYLIASNCHPKYFDHLEGYDVTLWHVFETTLESMRLLPRGEWAMTGGSSAGLRAMTMARFLGYKDIHIFGMDGSFDSESSHADFHPNNAFKVKDECVYNGKTFYTTPSIAECARQTFHELNQLSDSDVKFYGDGLLQEMIKDYIKPEKKVKMIGVRKPKLVTDEYKDLLKKTFEDYPEYGTGGSKHSTMVIKLMNLTASKSILDYGCGRGYLAKSLDFPIWEYDPAVEGKDEQPRPADLLVCTDVLEHIEPDKLFFVLDDIKVLTNRCAYIVISTRKAVKTLRDGRNAHLIVENPDWWKSKLEDFFFINDSWFLEPIQEFHAIVVPKYNTKLLFE